MSAEQLHRLRPDGLSWREIDDEVIALDHRTSAYVSVNASAVSLWRALVSGATKAQLVHLLVEGYGIEREPAAADVDAFLAELSAQGLLEG